MIQVITHDVLPNAPKCEPITRYKNIIKKFYLANCTDYLFQFSNFLGEKFTITFNIKKKKK